MNKIINKIKNNYPIFIYLLIVLLIGIINYKSGSWLSGWDNLMPEFNLLANMKRAIYAGWQEYQGLGLSGGMGYASDLPRQILLIISSVVIPTYLLRYLYAFLMLFLGPLGVYLFCKDLIFEKLDDKKKKVVSFIAGLFYLLNLATLQNFHFPFEPFMTHFGYLPLLLWSFLSCLREFRKGNLVVFVLINFFAVPQSYVPTVFIVYLLILLLMLLFIFLHEKTIIFVKNSIKLLIITFMINAFWLLPFIHFTVTNFRVPIEAKANIMYTEDAILRNQKSGHISDVIVLRGFWFDNVEPAGGIYQYIMPSWRQHLKDYYSLGVGLFLVVGLGVFYSLKTQKSKYVYGVLAVFLVTFSLIANADPPFNQLNKFLREGVPLFNQVFRFPFMKFSTTLSFSYAIFFAFGCLVLINLVEKIKNISMKKFLAGTTFVSVIIALVVFVYPIFQGSLFYQKIQAKIPDEYFQLFTYMKSQNPNTRIANFPQMTYTGWTFYRYNYSGSGFLWYGIEQPILDRAFDVWSSADENYYWEISYALYSKNRLLFENVLEKYNIDWILVDENVISLSSPKSTYTDEIYDIVSLSSKINFIASFGRLRLYQFRGGNYLKNYVAITGKLPVISLPERWGNSDIAHYENGNYISKNTISDSKPDLYYPFRSLFSGRSQKDQDFTVDVKDGNIYFKKEIPKDLSAHSLVLPSGSLNELIWIDPLDFTKVKFYQPEVRITDGFVNVKFPVVGGYYGAKIDPSTDPYIREAKNCNNFANGFVQNEVIEDSGEKYLRLIAKDAANCSVSFWIPQLPHNIGYLIVSTTRNVSGRALVFWLDNLNLKRSDMETYLSKDNIFTNSYLIQPPMEKDGIGYSLHFDNTSIGDEKTTNDLGEIIITPLPFDFMTKIKLARNGFLNQEIIYDDNFTVIHPNQFLYEIKSNSLSDKTVILSQAYNSGWSAFKSESKIPGILIPFVSEKIGEHVLVNNWANGWTISDQPSGDPAIYLIYLPQYLEFIGFGLWLVLLGWLGKLKKVS